MTQSEFARCLLYPARELAGYSTGRCNGCDDQPGLSALPRAPQGARVRDPGRAAEHISAELCNFGYLRRERDVDMS